MASFTNYQDGKQPQSLPQSPTTTTTTTATMTATQHDRYFESSKVTLRTFSTHNFLIWLWCIRFIADVLFFAHFHKLNWEKKARRKSWMLTKERRKIRTAWKQLRPTQNEGRKEPASERMNGKKALRCQHDAVPWHAILKANEIDDRNLATWHEANFRGHIQ